MIFNDTKVIPAQLEGRRGEASIGATLHKREGPREWQAFLRNAKRARVGDAIDFEIEDIVPFGVETGEPARLTGIFHPVGSELTAAEAKRSKINAFGIEYEGKTGLSSAFSWAA